MLIQKRSQVQLTFGLLSKVEKSKILDSDQFMICYFLFLFKVKK